MTDEVTRLRRLRKMALKFRALATYLHGGKRHGDLHERAALLGWRIARIATGRLRSHPYENYQRDQGSLESALDRLSAYGTAAVASLRGRRIDVFLEELNAASRELDNTRALTWSADLSDALGRAQQCMRGLISEVRGRATSKSDQPAPAGARESQVSSPYLAL